MLAMPDVSMMGYSYRGAKAMSTYDMLSVSLYWWRKPKHLTFRKDIAHIVFQGPPTVLIVQPADNLFLSFQLKYICFLRFC